VVFPESSFGVILLRFAGSSKAVGWLTLGGPVCIYSGYIRGEMTMKKEAMKTPERSRGELALVGVEEQARVKIS
jgi:hypothetical protein